MFGASQKNSWGQDLLLSRSAGAERVKVLFVTVTTSKNKYKTRTKQYDFQADVKKKTKKMHDPCQMCMFSPFSNCKYFL